MSSSVAVLYLDISVSIVFITVFQGFASSSWFYRKLKVQKLFCTQGFEPWTISLKVKCSAVELCTVCLKWDLNQRLQVFQTSAIDQLSYLS